MGERHYDVFGLVPLYAEDMDTLDATRYCLIQVGLREPLEAFWRGTAKADNQPYRLGHSGLQGSCVWSGNGEFWWQVKRY